MPSQSPGSSQTTQEPFRFYHYLSPRYWLTWIGLGLLRILVLLPYRFQLALGSALGTLLHWFPTRARAIARRNVQLCFPELSAPEHLQMARQSFQSMGIGLFETAMCWWKLESRILNRSEVHGLEKLEKQLQDGHGIILLTPHLTTIEVGGSVINRKLPVAVMYRNQSNQLADAIMVRARHRNCYKPVHRNNIREIVRTLRARRPVWYAPDQNYSGKQFVFADFFGIPAATTSATARIASMSRARIMPFYPVRREDCSGYDIFIEDPLEIDLKADEITTTSQINQALEYMIRKAPGQYLWAHRRFRNRPEGESPFY